MIIPPGSRLVILAAWFLIALGHPGMAVGLPIIPGAAGFGMQTPAGSGRHLEVPQTQVIKVTNLNDSGPGSMRAALAVKGPRVVVFEVGGYIDLDSQLRISNPYITVAGQTAPWPGIVLRYFGVAVGTHDVLIQHIGIRAGSQIKGWYMPHRSAMGVSGDNVVVDHCSMGWGHQVAMNLTGINTTLRLNIFSEGLYHAGHNEGNHSMGVGIGLGQQKLQGKRHGIALIGNLLAHNDGRNPDVSQNSTVAILNNIIYNYGSVGLKVMKDPLIASIQGNVFVPGVDTRGTAESRFRGKAAWIYLRHAESRVFFAPDNAIAGRHYDNPWTQINARRVMNEPDSQPIAEAIVWEPPVTVPGYAVKPSEEAERWVLTNVGPRPANRGPIDARIVFETATRTGRGREDLADAGGWPALEATRRELTPPTDLNGDDDKDGYTNLEEWLHTFADEVEGRRGPVPGNDPGLGQREAIRCIITPNEQELAAKVAMIRSLPKADWTFDSVEAVRRQKQASKQTGLPVAKAINLGDGVKIDLVLIPAGEFVMGEKYPPEVIKWRGPGRATDSSGSGFGSVPLYTREHPNRRVRIAEPYYIGRFEVTQEVWEKVMGERWPFKANEVGPDWRTDANRGSRKPVLLKTDSQTSQDLENTKAFIAKLNESVGKAAGMTFRLPTEAEWEYACRAGTDTPFWFGETISAAAANYDARLPWDHAKGEYRGHLMEVGSFAANAWGLFDTVGNVAELVSTPYGPLPDPEPTALSVQQLEAGQRKLAWGSPTLRGGSCRSAPADCRSAYGMYQAVYAGRERAGLRLVAEPLHKQ